MAIQVYECPEHGEFEVNIKMTDRLPPNLPCLWKGAGYQPCYRPSPHVLKPPHINVVDGTTPPR